MSALIVAWYVWLFFTTITLFIAMVCAKSRIDSGIDLTLFWRVVFRILFVMFIVANVTWNLTLAWPMFWERPHEWLFTNRCKRHKRRDAQQLTRRGRLAWWWCRQLNQIDPGHC